MIYSPHEYQDYAKKFIIDHPEAAILLECGMGKTVITLTAIQELINDYFEVKRVLIIAPLRVGLSSWPSEIAKWDHLKNLKYSVAIGSTAKRLAALNDKAAQVVIINRENVDWLISHNKWDFDMVVVDELSSFKNHRSKRFKALMSVRPHVKRIVGLTGTPASNGLMDLWAEVKLLDMGKRLGRFIGGYRDRFFLPDKRNQQIVFSYKPLPEAESKIYSLISDITISMKLSDYIAMPECIMAERMVTMNSHERKKYDTLRDEMFIQLQDKEIDAVSAAALSNKLLQMANGFVYASDKEAVHIHDRKLDALEDLIEAANGKPVLVAFWFKDDIERIRSRFPAREIKTTKDIADWNSGSIQIGLIHPASAGHGLNLQQGGSVLIWFGLTWSLELYQQTNARLYRQGQKSTVVIEHIIAENTIDEDVMAALRRKDKTQAALIDSVKARIGG